MAMLKDHDYTDYVWAQSPGLLIVHCMIHYHIHQTYNVRVVPKETLSILQATIIERWDLIEHPHKEVLGFPHIGDNGLTTPLPKIVRSVADKIYKTLCDNGHTFLTLKTKKVIPMVYELCGNPS